IIPFVPHSGRGKRLIKYNNEVVSKICRNATVILSRKADYFPFFRNYFDLGALITRVYSNKSTILFVKGESKNSCPLRRRNFRMSMMIGKVHLIIIWMNNLGFMRKPTLSTFLRKFRATIDRH